MSVSEFFDSTIHEQRVMPLTSKRFGSLRDILGLVLLDLGEACPETPVSFFLSRIDGGSGHTLPQLHAPDS